MFKNRAIFNGNLAEIFGKDALPLDKFARTLGYNRIATQTWNSLPEYHKANLKAYSDGVNDFISNVKIGEGSAMLLPLEFYIFSL
jgi:penicillin amidase